MLTEIELFELIGDIHELTVDPSKMANVQELFCSATGAIGVHFLNFDKNQTPIESQVYSNLGHQFAQEASEEYIKEYSSLDIDRISNLFKTGKRKAFSNEELTPDSEKKTNAVYNEYFPKFLSEHQLISGIKVISGELFTISQARSRTEGEFSNTERTLFEQLSSQVFKAMHQRSKFIDIYGRAATLIDITNNKEMALLLLDSNWKLQWANNHGAELLSELDTISLNHGQVTLGNFAQRKELQRLVTQASFLSMIQRQQMGSLVAQLNEHKYVIDVFSLKHDSLLDVQSKNLALIAIRKPKPNKTPDLKTLKSFFNLTPAESRLALAIAENKSIKEYAEEYNLKDSTVRSTMKIVLDKVGVNRQTQLALKIASLPT